MDALQQRLRQMQKNMEQVQQEYKPCMGFEPLQDGEYNIIFRPEMKMTKSEKLMVTWIIIIADGDHEGRKIFENTVLEGNDGPASVNQAGSHICRRFVEACGKTWPEKLIQLKQVLAEIDSEENVVAISLRMKPGSETAQYPSYYINPKASSESVDTSPAPEVEAIQQELALRPLLDFCTKHGIDGVFDTDTDEELVQKLKDGGAFKEDEIEAEEVEMLRSFDPELIASSPEPEKTKKPLSRGSNSKSKKW